MSQSCDLRPLLRCWTVYTPHSVTWAVYTAHSVTWDVYTAHSVTWAVYTAHSVMWALLTSQCVTTQLHKYIFYTAVKKCLISALCTPYYCTTPDIQTKILKNSDYSILFLEWGWTTSMSSGNSTLECSPDYTHMCHAWVGKRNAETSLSLRHRSHRNVGKYTPKDTSHPRGPEEPEDLDLQQLRYENNGSRKIYICL